MNELRETMMSELEIMATKSRFGLFSQAPPLACGDDSPSKRKLRILTPIKQKEVKMVNL